MARAAAVARASALFRQRARLALADAAPSPAAAFLALVGWPALEVPVGSLAPRWDLQYVLEKSYRFSGARGLLFAGSALGLRAQRGRWKETSAVLARRTPCGASAQRQGTDRFLASQPLQRRFPALAARPGSAAGLGRAYHAGSAALSNGRGGGGTRFNPGVTATGCLKTRIFLPDREDAGLERRAGRPGRPQG